MYTTVSSLLTRLPKLDDEQAWAVFEERYSPLLRQFFMRSGFGRDSAQDLVQDTIERAVTGLRRGDYDQKRGRLRDWIAGIARNIMRNYRRKRRAHTNVGAATGGFWERREDPSALDDIAAFERRFDVVWVRARLSALIREAARVFPRRDLRCYFLMEVHGLPVAEVAKRVGVSRASTFAKRRAVADWFLAVGPRFFASWEQ